MFVIMTADGKYFAGIEYSTDGQNIRSACLSDDLGDAFVVRLGCADGFNSHFNPVDFYGKSIDLPYRPDWRIVPISLQILK